MNMGSRLVTKEKTGFTLAETNYACYYRGSCRTDNLKGGLVSPPYYYLFEFSHAELVSASQIKRISIM